MRQTRVSDRSAQDHMVMQPGICGAPKTSSPSECTLSKRQRHHQSISTNMNPYTQTKSMTSSVSNSSGSENDSAGEANEIDTMAVDTQRMCDQKCGYSKTEPAGHMCEIQELQNHIPDMGMRASTTIQTLQQLIQRRSELKELDRQLFTLISQCLTQLDCSESSESPELIANRLATNLLKKHHPALSEFNSIVSPAPTSENHIFATSDLYCSQNVATHDIRRNQKIDSGVIDLSFNSIYNKNDMNHSAPNDQRLERLPSNLFLGQNSTPDLVEIQQKLAYPEGSGPFDSKALNYRKLRLLSGASAHDNFSGETNFVDCNESVRNKRLLTSRYNPAEAALSLLKPQKRFKTPSSEVIASTEGISSGYENEKNHISQLQFAMGNVNQDSSRISEANGIINLAYTDHRYPMSSANGLAMLTPGCLMMPANMEPNQSLLNASQEQRSLSTTRPHATYLIAGQPSRLDRDFNEQKFPRGTPLATEPVLSDVDNGSNVNGLVKNQFMNRLTSEQRKMVAYRCHVCGSGFEDRHRLQQHLSIHLNLHPSWFEERTIKETMAQYESKRGDYLCTSCTIRFETTAEFDKHMQLHGEKPHKCELCDQGKNVSFRYYRQLLTHLRSHCFLYSCRFSPECKQTANRKDYLKLHILKHHLNNKLPECYAICCH